MDGNKIDLTKTKICAPPWGDYFVSVNGTDWKGPDAEKFRSEWSGSHVTALAKVAQALEEAGKQATKNAAQQEEASR